MISPIDFLPSDALGRLLEQSRMSVQTGTEGTEVPEGEEEDVILGGPTRDADYARTMRGLVGLRFCAAVYGSERREEGLLAADFACWARHAGVWAMEYDTEYALIAAVKSCGARMMEVPGLAERLAASPYERVRYALAQSLPKSAVSVLQGLAGDANKDVRKAANARLDVALRTDAFPISTDGHSEAVLAKARRILDLPTHHYDKHQRTAVLAMRPLSDPLAVAVWERLLLAGSVRDDQFLPWIRALLERPGGEHVFVRLFTGWCRTQDSYFVEDKLKKLGKLSNEARCRIFEALLSAMNEVPEDRTRAQFARCVAHLAAPCCDLMKLLEVVLGVPIERASDTAHDYDYPLVELGKAFDKVPAQRALHKVFLAALREGARGRWKRLPGSVWKRLSPDPVAREHAHRELALLSSVDDDNLAELVRNLFQHRDPVLDGTEAKLVGSLYAHPRLRPALIQQTKEGKKLAKQSLLRDELAIDAVCEFVLRGLADRSQREADQLWASVRRARDTALAVTFDIDQCALIRPGQSFEQSDLAVAQRAYAVLLANEPMEGDYLRFINVLHAVRAPESEAMLNQLVETSEVPGLKDVIESYRALEAQRRERDA